MRLNFQAFHDLKGWKFQPFKPWEMVMANWNPFTHGKASTSMRAFNWNYSWSYPSIWEDRHAGNVFAQKAIFQIIMWLFLHVFRFILQFGTGRCHKGPVLYSCNVAKLPDVTIWQLMWPDVAESDQKPFFDKSVNFWHFATIFCNLWPGVARSDQQRADIVLPGVPKSCQVWPGVTR